MSSRVTAIIVVRNGAQHLPRTLEAIAAQSLQPDAVIAVEIAKARRDASESGAPT